MPLAPRVITASVGVGRRGGVTPYVVTLEARSPGPALARRAWGASFWDAFTLAPDAPQDVGPASEGAAVDDLRAPWSRRARYQDLGDWCLWREGDALVAWFTLATETSRWSEGGALTLGDPAWVDAGRYLYALAIPTAAPEAWVLCWAPALGAPVGPPRCLARLPLVGHLGAATLGYDDASGGGLAALLDTADGEGTASALTLLLPGGGRACEVARGVGRALRGRSVALTWEGDVALCARALRWLPPREGRPGFTVILHAARWELATGAALPAGDALALGALDDPPVWGALVPLDDAPGEVGGLVVDAAGRCFLAGHGALRAVTLPGRLIVPLQVHACDAGLHVAVASPEGTLDLARVPWSDPAAPFPFPDEEVQPAHARETWAADE